MTNESPADRAEARRVRRRWLNLGEAVAVIAVIISGLTLWNSWSERRESDAKSAAQAVKASTVDATIVLSGTAAEGGKRLTLKPLSEAQTIQGQTISFPATLEVAPVETTGDPRIEAGWFAKALVSARKEAGLKPETTGDRRLPVAIETRFLADGTLHSTRSLYDVGYAVTGGGLFGGSEVKLKGLSLIGQGKIGRLDALMRERLAL